MPALRDLDRRWWVAIAVAVIAVLALVLSQTVFNRTSEECRPVRDLLDFNRAQSEEIAKTDTAPQANIGAYQTWADGVAERAGRVSDPALAAHAVRLSEAANQFVVLLAQVPSGRYAEAPPGTQTPPAVYEMATLNDHITAETQILAEKCPA